MIPVAQPVYGAGQLPVAVPVAQPYGQPVGMQMMPMQPAVACAPQPQYIIQQAPQTIIIQNGAVPRASFDLSVDRQDPLYIDAADVAGCWLQMYFGIFPVCSQLDAVSPDEVGAPGCCCIGLFPCCVTPTPVFQRAGPRRFDHIEGVLVFTSDHTLIDESKPTACESVKLCGPGPWSCFDPWC